MHFFHLTSDNFRSLSKSALALVSFKLSSACFILCKLSWNPILHAIRMPEFKRVLVSLRQTKLQPIFLFVSYHPGNDIEDKIMCILIAH